MLNVFLQLYKSLSFAKMKMKMNLLILKYKISKIAARLREEVLEDTAR